MGSAYLSPAVTLRTYLRFRARLCPGAMALLASSLLEDLNLHLLAEGGIGKRYLEIIPEIGASACTPAGGARGKAEEILKDVAE